MGSFVDDFENISRHANNSFPEAKATQAGLTSCIIS